MKQTARSFYKLESSPELRAKIMSRYIEAMFAKDVMTVQAIRALALHDCELSAKIQEFESEIIEMSDSLDQETRRGNVKLIAYTLLYFALGALLLFCVW